MQQITPFLWFEKDAEKAAGYYTQIFPNSKILSVTHYPEAAENVSGMKAGSVMAVDLILNGVSFQFLNGGKIPGFDLNHSAVSFVVHCETQDEIDHYWKMLSFVPEAEQCGWCRDKFGVTWQIVPNILGKYLSDTDKSKVERVTSAFLKMKKFDIHKLSQIYEGKSV